MVVAVRLGAVGAAGLLVVRTAVLATDSPVYILKLVGCTAKMNWASTDAAPETFRAINFCGLRVLIVSSLHRLPACSAVVLARFQLATSSPSPQSCSAATTVMSNGIVLTHTGIRLGMVLQIILHMREGAMPLSLIFLHEFLLCDVSRSEAAAAQLVNVLMEALVHCFLATNWKLLICACEKKFVELQGSKLEPDIMCSQKANFGHNKKTLISFDFETKY